ncbi:hypothetical protein EV127DRAFT_441099 [Xylaria flabelliformis]|nr:hypothetical protein EV127DRAFT_441099 [Xylaria flabelliformis]
MRPVHLKPKRNKEIAKGLIAANIITQRNWDLINDEIFESPSQRESWSSNLPMSPMHNFFYALEHIKMHNRRPECSVPVDEKLLGFRSIFGDLRNMNSPLGKRDETSSAKFFRSLINAAINRYRDFYLPGPSPLQPDACVVCRKTLKVANIFTVVAGAYMRIEPEQTVLVAIGQSTGPSKLAAQLVALIYKRQKEFDAAFAEQKDKKQHVLLIQVTGNLVQFCIGSFGLPYLEFLKSAKTRTVTEAYLEELKAKENPISGLPLVAASESVPVNPKLSRKKPDDSSSNTDHSEEFLYLQRYTAFNIANTEHLESIVKICLTIYITAQEKEREKEREKEQE